MAGYSDQLRPASFRNIDFLMIDSNSNLGRRMVRHDYPGRDVPYYEDQGSVAEEFSIQAIIAGSDYIQKADALESALSQKGSGVFVHPLYGSVNVVVTEASRFFSTDKMGEISFTVRFSVYQEPVYPATRFDTVSALKKASDLGFLAAADDFMRFTSFAGKADFVFQDATNHIANYQSHIKTILSKTGIIEKIQANFFALPTQDDLENPKTFIGNNINLIKRIADLALSSPKPVIGQNVQEDLSIEQRRRILPALNEIAAYQSSMAFHSGSGSVAVRQKNVTAIDQFFKIITLSGAVRAAQAGLYNSREDALLRRDQTVKHLNALRTTLAVNEWDQSWHATNQLVSSLSQDINDHIGRLPKTIRIKSGQVRSSLALSHRLYGDQPSKVMDKANDLVARNKIIHPSFVSPEILEVIVDG
jgi:prophage DNA circulation protein